MTSSTRKKPKKSKTKEQEEVPKSGKRQLTMIEKLRAEKC